MIRKLKEVAFGKKFRHEDAEFGMLRRVGGYWRVEQPDFGIDVAVKLEGSDRFGPSKKALEVYRTHRFSIPSLLRKLEQAVVADLALKQMEWTAEESVFHFSEVLVPKHKRADLIVLFTIEQDELSFYSGFALGSDLAGYERATYE